MKRRFLIVFTIFTILSVTIIGVLATAWPPDSGNCAYCGPGSIHCVTGGQTITCNATNMVTCEIACRACCNAVQTNQGKSYDWLHSCWDCCDAYNNGDPNGPAHCLLDNPNNGGG